MLAKIKTMDTKKENLIAEEKAALDTPIDARIHTVDLPPETKDEVEAKGEKLWKQFPCFKTKEDAMYFSMLPLDRKDSVMVLQKAIEIEREEAEEAKKWGDPVSER